MTRVEFHPTSSPAHEGADLTVTRPTTLDLGPYYATEEEVKQMGLWHLRTQEEVP